MDDATFNLVDRGTARERLLENLRWQISLGTPRKYIMRSTLYYAGKSCIRYARGKVYVGGVWPDGVERVSSWSELVGVHVFDVREALDELMGPQLGFDFAGGVA